MKFISKQAAESAAIDQIAQELIITAGDFLRGSSWRMSLHGQVSVLANLVRSFDEAYCDEAFREVHDENYQEVPNHSFDPAKQEALREAAYSLASNLYHFSPVGDANAFLKPLDESLTDDVGEKNTQKSGELFFESVHARLMHHDSRNEDERAMLENAKAAAQRIYEVADEVLAWNTNKLPMELISRAGSAFSKSMQALVEVHDQVCKNDSFALAQEDSSA